MFKRLREDMDTILLRDPAARSRLEVLLCYPGLHALTIHRWAHGAWQRGWPIFARWLSQLARGLTGIEIHPGATIGRRVFIDHGMGVVIGETAEVGDDCTIYQGVTLGGTSLVRGKRHPTLLPGVVVGAGAKVLGPFAVGENAKIGSNAVVTKAVAAGATMIGNPARQLVAPAVQAAFAAYGLTDNADDPLVKAIHGLIEQLAQQQTRVEQVENALQAAGVPCARNEQPCAQTLQSLNRLVDE
jgi:serine O-acetyltransferase